MPLERQAIDSTDSRKTDCGTVSNGDFHRLARSDDLIDVEIPVIHRGKGMKCGKWNSDRVALGQLLLAGHEDTYHLGRAGEGGVGDKQFSESGTPVTNCLHDHRATDGSWHGCSIKRIEQRNIAQSKISRRLTRL